MDKKTALIVIDMQRGFLDESSPCYIAGAQATVPACAAVIAECRRRGIPVFFVTRLYRADGSDVEHTRHESWLRGGRPISPGCREEMSAEQPEEFGTDERDYHISKPRYSAFFHTELDLLLRRLGINSILLAGTTTPNCIRATCYDGISLEYNVAVLSDCSSSATEEIQRSNLRDMANVGAQIFSGADFISGRAEIIDSVDAVRRRVRA